MSRPMRVGRRRAGGRAAIPSDASGRGGRPVHFGRLDAEQGGFSEGRPPPCGRPGFGGGLSGAVGGTTPACSSGVGDVRCRGTASATPGPGIAGRGPRTSMDRPATPASAYPGDRLHHRVVVVNDTAVAGSTAEQGWLPTRVENVPGDILRFQDRRQDASRRRRSVRPLATPARRRPPATPSSARP